MMIPSDDDGINRHKLMSYIAYYRKWYMQLEQYRIPVPVQMKRNIQKNSSICQLSFY